ncbi:MAG: hypothetical protein ACYS21_00135, partial [Planctomycetota bacterium]
MKSLRTGHISIVLLGSLLLFANNARAGGTPDPTWVTGAADFEIWLSDSLTWDAGTLVASATLTDNNASTVSATPRIILPDTTYRVQMVVKNDGDGDSKIEDGTSYVRHYNTKGSGNWAGTSPTLGNGAWKDFGANNKGVPDCTVSWNGNNVHITNVDPNEVKIAKDVGDIEGVSYLITTDSDPNTSSASYVYVLDEGPQSEDSSKITITAAGAVRQNHYRWRADSDGLNSQASGWLAAEDTLYGGATEGTTVRLRIEAANTGSGAVNNLQYRLEYATDTAGSWTAVPVTASASEHFEMVASSQYADGDNITASYLTATGTWANGKGIEDPNNMTANYSLTNAYYTEFEYAIEPTSDVTSATYYFRVTDNGTTSDFAYMTYPELRISGPYLDQNHYRWRDDLDGLNSQASGWLAAEDTAYSDLEDYDPIRLRIELANTGTADANNYQHLLEYATNTGGPWTTVPVTATTQHFEMVASSQYTDGENITGNYLTATGTWANGKGIEDPSNKTANYSLTNAYYTELEYAIQATGNFTPGGTYYFRVTDDGSDPNYTYTRYPAVTMYSTPDMTWETGAADFEIWESSSLTWDAGTLVASATLTDDTVEIVSATPGGVKPSTQYRVQAVLKNISGDDDIKFKDATDYVRHYSVKGAGNWAGTSPTLGNGAWNDFGGNNKAGFTCTTSWDGNNVHITNTSGNDVKLAKAIDDTEGISYLITTDTDPVTSSTSYWYALEETGLTKTSSKIRITAVRESYETGQDSEVEVRSDQNAGQTFSHNSGDGTYTLSTVSVYMRRDSDATSQTITVSIRSSWGGANIYSGSFDSDDLGTSFSFMDVDVSPLTALTDSTTYYIRVTSDVTDGKIWYGYDSTGGYANGDRIDKDGIAQSGEDLLFKLWAGADLDGDLTSAAGVTEPIAISSIADTEGERVAVFDFTISDGGTSDVLALGVSQIVLNTSGTGDFNDLTWQLSGPDVSYVTGTVGAGTITFDSLNISVADGASEVYTVYAYFSTSPTSTDNQTFILSVDGDTDLTVGSAGTQMGTTSAVNNGAGSTMNVVHSQIIVSTQPPSAATTDTDFVGTIAISATDVNGNVDEDFSENITISAVKDSDKSPGSGTLSSSDAGGLTKAPTSGIATWTDTKYDTVEVIDIKAVSATTYTTGIYSSAVTVRTTVGWGETDALGTATTGNWARAMTGVSDDVDYMILKSVAIYCGATHSEQMRMAVYQGGSDADNPDGATLVWEGLTSGSGTNQWITVTADDSALAKNTRTWIAFKTNNNGFSVAYQNSSPATHDFETDDGRFESDGSVSSDENTAYPATWPSDAGTRSGFWYSVYLTYDTNSPPDAPTFYDVDTVQLAFNNAKINDDTPTFRLAATDPESHDVDYTIDIDDDPAFGSVNWSEEFTNGGEHYTSGSQVNLTMATLTGITNGTTYYVRARAKDPDGSGIYGSNSSGTYSFTYSSTAGDLMWFQTTDEQFDTGTLTSTETTGSDSVQLEADIKQVYTTPGSTTFDVPAGVTEIIVKTWGPGGGGGGGGIGPTGDGAGGAGGGGGFAMATITVTPEDTLNVYVGGGGGAGIGATTQSGAGGGGAGFSGVKRGATELVVAGGGGGGGGGDNSSATAGGAGGVGGGSTGGSGGGSGTATGGGGGAQGSGGAVGTGQANGAIGTADQGGAGGQVVGTPGATGGAGGSQGGGDGGDEDTAGHAGGGGAGGGIYGGGGGGSSVSGNAGGGGGGGGPNTLTGTSQTDTQAAGSTGAGQGDSDYQAGTGDGGSGGAQGGNNGTAGEPGAVVILYDAGTITSAAIDFDSFVEAADWNQLLFTDDETNGTVSYDVEYWDGDSWEDTAITGQTSSPVDISSLDPVTHNQIRIEATLDEGTDTPYLQDWTVTIVVAPSAPTLYSTGGSDQLSFNNAKQNTTTPRFRASATCSTNFDRFFIEINTQADFAGTAYTQAFSGTYVSGTQYNLLCDSLSTALPTTDGVTYYVRSKASANAGGNWGDWSSGTWSFTYNATAGAKPMWFQTTDEQFDTGTLSDTSTDAPNDRVKISGWLSGGWDQRIKMTIDSAGSKVDSDLTDFPILVYLSTSSGIGSDDVSAVFDELTADANRKKIAVTKSDGTTELYVEIEEWDDASETAWLWVKVAGTNSISSSADTDLYLYYDVDHADNTTYVGDSGSRTEVWDPNFVGVWHLIETAGAYQDSTSNNNDSTAISVNSRTATGKIGSDTPDFEQASGHSITITNVVAEVGTSTGTLEMWVNIENEVDEQLFVFIGEAGSGNGYGTQDELHIGTGNPYTGNQYSIYVESTGSIGDAAFGTSDTGVWEHVVGTYSDSNSVKLYENGTFAGEDTDFGAVESANWAAAFIGRPTAAERYFDGLADEVRISNSARSAAWTEASFYSGDDDLITFGSEETPTSTITSPAIDHDSFDNATDWNQLLFTDVETNGTVSYDVEYWDGDSWEDTAITGQGSSPVDISSLDPATHDQIRIEATLTETTDTPYLQDWTVTIFDGDKDGDLTSAAGVTEPVAISSIADTVGERVAVFDFTISDGGTSDAYTLDVSEIVLNTSGTGTFTDLTWQLDGPDASFVTGTVAAGTITFDSLSISVANGASEVYTVYAYFSSSPTSTDNQTFILAVDGDTDLTVDPAGTWMGTTAEVNNGAGSTMNVVHTQIIFSTQPPASASVNTDFAGTIGVSGTDVNGNVDEDFNENITISAVLDSDKSPGSGTLSSADAGGLTQTPSSGTATWTDTKYDTIEVIDIKAVSATYAAGLYSTAVTVTGDSDGDVTSAGGVTEPVAISSIADTVGERVAVFDFTITDGGTSDAVALGISQIVLNTSGTGTFSDLTWQLNGPDVSYVTGSVAAGTITFNGLSISVADGASEVYTVYAYFSTSPTSTENQTFILSVDGDTDLTVTAGGTQMGTTSPVNNGAGSTMNVVHTQLTFTTQPPAAAAVSVDFVGTIAVSGTDINGNVDVDFNENITISPVLDSDKSPGSGTLSSTDPGGLTKAPSSGTATWTDTKYDTVEVIDIKAVSATTYTTGIYSSAVTVHNWVITQTHYRWRNDDGSQAAATWKAAEDEVSTRAKSGNLRLRFVATNTGAASANNYQYLIEYATSTSGPWTAVPVTASASEHFEMTTTSQYADGDATTAQLTGTGSWAAGKCVEDPNNKTANYSLTNGDYTEFEYCFEATTDAIDGEVYYFRLTNDGVVLDAYDKYPELVVGVYVDASNSADFLTLGQDRHTFYDPTQVNDSAANLTSLGIWQDGTNVYCCYTDGSTSYERQITIATGAMADERIFVASESSPATLDADNALVVVSGASWENAYISSGAWSGDTYRTGIDFDTTSIPDAATITKVELNLYIDD